MFSPVYREAEGESTVRIALKIMCFCGQADPQARRYQSILESFFEALQAPENAKEQATNKNSRTSDIFSMFFGNESSNFSEGEPSAATHNRMPVTSIGPMAWSDGQFPISNNVTGLEKQCDTSGINERVEERSSSMDVPDGQCDISIDSSDIWWSGRQDIFTTAGDTVPLYGLMDSNL